MAVIVMESTWTGILTPCGAVRLYWWKCLHLIRCIVILICLSFIICIISFSLLSLIAVGVSSDCCAFNYPGTAAVSEKESQALTAFLSNRTDEIICYFTIHSYGQQILIPYGHPHVSVPNYNELVSQHHMKITPRYYMFDMCLFILENGCKCSVPWLNILQIFKVIRSTLKKYYNCYYKIYKLLLHLGKNLFFLGEIIINVGQKRWLLKLIIMC